LIAVPIALQPESTRHETTTAATRELRFFIYCFLVKKSGAGMPRNIGYLDINLEGKTLPLELQKGYRQ